ncbi:MAG: AMP-binding protein [Jatrophihabitans sp.]
MSRENWTDVLLGESSRLDAELIAHYRNVGAWRGIPLGHYLADAVAAAPDRLATISVDGTGEVVRSLTYRQLDELSRRIAAGLRGLGVDAGDTVSVMVPNCSEFSAIAYAISRLGAVYSGIPITYGRRELGFMLGRARTRVLIIAASHHGQDLLALARDVLADNRDVEHVVVIGSPDAQERRWISFRELIATAPLAELPEVDPYSIAQLAFTSGTTSEPKAVMNLHATLDSVVTSWLRHVGGGEAMGEPVVNLIMSPVGHSTGYFWGALLTAYLHGTAVYLDRWSPEIGLRALREQKVTTMIGSPTFLLDVLRLEETTAQALPDLRLVSVPGAPIPRTLVPRAREQLGCAVIPAWGMTEYGIGVSGSVALPRDRVEATDGIAVAPCEVRVSTADGTMSVRGEEGDLQIRGPGLFAGYYQRPDFTAEAFTRDGWFQTGDRAAVDAAGYVSLLGRTKDIVIRGGENIPVIDIENLLYRHPAVAEVAVIGIPDERLGERAHAVLVMTGNAPMTLHAMREYLLAQGLSKRFLPEGVTVVEAMPKTMSGKIRKVELRLQFAQATRA